MTEEIEVILDNALKTVTGGKKMKINCTAKSVHYVNESELNELLQPGAIWISGTHYYSIMAQVMHYNKERGLVFCIRKTNYGYEDIEPDIYTLEEFIRDFSFMGVKE